MKTNENKNALRILIVDDEPEACESLRTAIETTSTNVELTGTAHNTRDAEMLINEHKPNVVFFDINMPGENAFQFLERIPEYNFEIVFVTAYDHFAIRALKLNAIDYLLKPIDATELTEALKKLEDRVHRNILMQGMMSINEVTDEAARKAPPTKITFRDLNATEIVELCDLYYIEAKGSYSHVVFQKHSTDKHLLVSHPISEYEDILPGDIFCRIHKSYLVNGSHIRQIRKEDYTVNIADKYKLPVSRRRYADVVTFIRSNTLNRN